jgi:hypothetical protein
LIFDIGGIGIGIEEEFNLQLKNSTAHFTILKFVSPPENPVID